MQVFAHGNRMPALQFKQQPMLSFAALPFNVPGEPPTNLVQEMIDRAGEFPLVEDFELIVAAIGKAAPDAPLGTEVNALFLDRAANQLFASYNLYDFNPDQADPQIWQAAPGQLVSYQDEDYAFILTADDQFVYVAEGETPAGYRTYGKIPRARYLAEWQALLESLRK